MSKRKKKYQDSFKRPSPSVKPRKTGFEVLNKNFEVPMRVFKKNMEEIRTLFYEKGSDENIRRFCIILLCGAMDKYMHDIVRTMILQIFSGNAKPGKNFEGFLIPIELLHRFDKASFEYAEKERILNEAVYNMISGFTMQKSNAIDRNMNYIIDFNIWKSIQPRMNSRFQEFSSITSMKSFVDELANRRNAIAHELDFKPTTTTKNEISHDYVSRSIEIVEWMIQAMNYQILDNAVNFHLNKNS